MDEYRKQIDNLINKSDGEVALNGSTSHASMVIERMLARSLSEVRILTKKLDPLIYDDETLQRSALDFLKSGKKLHILVEEFSMQEKQSSAFLDRLKLAGDIEVRQVPEKLREPIEINFSLMDERGFRIEKDESGATAVVSFGNKTVNSRLLSLFDKVWVTSTEVNPA